MSTHRLLSLALAVAWLSIPPPTLADDLAPAPFRGQPHSVMAKFDLFGAPTPGGPVQYNTVGGVYPIDPLQPMVGNPVTDPASGDLIYPIALPNYIDPLPLKLIRIQYSWFGAAPSTGDPGDAAALQITPSPGGSVQLVGATPPMLIPGTGNIYHRWDDYEIIPNPDSERFEIAFSNADPRWVIIDTISLPEPTTALLAGMLGCVAIVRRR